MTAQTAYSPEEFLITTITRLLPEKGNAAVGAASPVPGSAVLLQRELTGGALRASLIQGTSNNPFTDGGRELFDAAGEGRIDVFFLGGVQIDGQANLNLVGTGEYPNLDRRFPGSFGSAHMYFVVPRVILFRPEHTRRVFVEKVDFISAPGVSPPDVYRPGGPHAAGAPARAPAAGAAAATVGEGRSTDVTCCAGCRWVGCTAVPGPGPR